MTTSEPFNRQSAIGNRQFVACLLAIAALANTASAATGWADEAWKYRRAVDIAAYQPSKLAGDDIAVLTMPTAGLLGNPDASDVRVMTLDGAQTPSRVLMVGPGDTIRLAFAIHGSAKRYYVYFGNPKPTTPRKELEIRRGVLMETWDYPGGPAKDLDQTRKIFDSLKEPLGRAMRDQVYIGYNPFGPQSRIASAFTGYLVSPTDGEYTFACSSMNASFLLIDDQLVIDNGGFHKPQHDVSKQAALTLKTGPHKVTLYHVSPHGEPIVALAWRPPGADKIVPIPAGAFAHYLPAAPAPLEQYGKDLTIDFIPAFAGESFLAERYYERYSFSALSSGVVGNSVKWQWDFGDGQASDKQSDDHVYLAAGTYSVTLTAKTLQEAGTLTRTNKIVVARPWEDIIAATQDKPAQLAGIVAGYDFAALSPAANAQAVMLLDQAGKFDDLAKAGAAFVARQAAGDEAITETLPIWSAAMVRHGKADQAAKGLLQAAKMTQNAAIAATMTAQAGRIFLDDLADPNQAMATFEQVITKYQTATTPAIRRARIGIGDVWRFRGDADKALAAYRDAKPLADADKKLPIMRGDFSRHVEGYLRAKEYEDAADWLARWEDALPAEKLDGYWSLLRVRLLLAQSRPADAVIEAQALVKVAPDSNYAAPCLMCAADACITLKQSNQANQILRQIVDKYPESPLANDAKKRLGLPTSQPATAPVK